MKVQLPSLEAINAAPRLLSIRIFNVSSMVIYILLFYASLESIVLGTVFWHVFTRGIREFVNGSDGCPPDCGILKSVSLLQPFPKIVSGPICLDGLEFLLNVTKPHGTNASFGPYFVLGPGCDFVFALFLAFEFSIIVEILVFEDDCDWSGVFLV